MKIYQLIDDECQCFPWYIFYNCEYIFVFIYLEYLIIYSSHIMLTELTPHIENKNRREISYAGHHIFINTSKVISA